jgi:hypothetical protein
MAATTPHTAPRIVPGGQAPRHVAEALFPDAAIGYVDGFEAMADLLDSFDDQRPSTCGAYVARYVLPTLGVAEHDGVATTREDYLAFLAGTVLDPVEAAPVEAARAEARRLKLDDVAAADRFGEAWYGWPLRVSADEAELGTSPTGTARAVAIASGGSLVTLPVPARDPSGDLRLTEGAWNGLLDLLERDLADWRIHPIVNYESDQLLDPTSAAYDAPALTSTDPGAVIPLDRWGVGHFAGVGALWRAGDGRRWLLLLDTYRERGYSRYQPQPAELVRRALVRGDGREGGVLLVLPRAHLDAAAAAIRELGLDLRIWGNGSPEPEGWSWELGR